MTKEELYATLNWMLAMGIIDHTTYNQLLLKSLPFTQ